MSYRLSFQPLSPPAPPQEIEALANMARSTFSDTFRHYPPADIETYLRESLSPEVLAAEVEDPACQFTFVVINEEKAGFLKWVFPSERYLQHVELPSQRPFLLERFYFLPEYRGKGVTAVALAYVTSYAKYQAEADYIYLSVWDRTYRAQSFYQKHGFKTIGSFHYPVGQVLDHELLFGMRL